MMKAAYYDRQGKARDVLVVTEVARPEPGPHEVRVRMHVSGLNPTDVKARSGFSAAMAFARIIPHQDGAGIIDAVGDGVDDTRLGERVWIFEAQFGRASGTAADYAIVATSHAIALPDGVSFEIGACLGIPALTAHRCLFADGGLDGRRVLVHGGAGAVGTAAILLAKWAGAWVAATVRRPEHEAAARAAGADLVINSRREDVVAAIRSATGGLGVDRIVDVDLPGNLDIDMACLAQGGVVSSYAVGTADERLALPMLQAMKGGCVFRFVFIYTVPDIAKRAAIADITACLETGAYRPLIGLVLPLARIVDAHEAQEAGTVTGKILVTML